MPRYPLHPLTPAELRRLLGQDPGPGESWDHLLAYELRSIAENDYNIDGAALPEGEILYEAARRLEEKSP